MSSDYSRCCGGGGGCKPTSPFTGASRHDRREQDKPQTSTNRNNCPFTYSGKHLYAIDFPLGGFGAGNVNIAGDGSLQHWTILNQVQQYPNWRDNPMPASWFGLQVLQTSETQDDNTKNIHSTILRTRSNSCEAFQNSPLPSIDSLTIQGQYPIANLNYDLPKEMPITASVEAMSPLIPGEVQDSSIPCAIFTVTLENSTSQTLQTRVLMGQQNFLGWNGRDKLQATMKGWGDNVNTPFVDDTSEGLLLSARNSIPYNQDPNSGTLCLTAVPASHDSKATTSVITQACDEIALWQQFTNGSDVPVAQAVPSIPSPPTTTNCCGVVQSVTLAPHGKATVIFVLTWHFPNRTLLDSTGRKNWHTLPNMLGNYYSTHWFPDNAKQVLDYVAKKLSYLTETTRLYRDILYRSSIPPELLECAAGRVSVLRSPTMWYTAEGIVMGSEGNGCCPLNCTHVYGYTTLMERLFPTLAQNMRISDFVRTYDAPEKSIAYCGGVPMRYGTGGWALDGTLASIIKTYLVVQQSDPDLSFLKQVWPNVKDQMKRILEYFDTQGDGVIRGLQQNTYDTAMVGANTFIGSYVVTALKAFSCMADLMGDLDLATTCKEHAQLSARNYESICWNESYGYYIADVTANDCKNSYGRGCALDQLCAVGLSSACGFGHIFDPKHETKARQSILKYNHVTKPPFQDQQHHFYDGDEGLRLLSYPYGKDSDGEWIYENLVGSGFTSPFIAGLLLDGKIQDAQEVASHIRQRHDGRNASPWNEPECNTLYTRAMAHWNIFDQACGFRYACQAASAEIDKPSGSLQGGRLSFEPRVSLSDFRCFVTLNGGWGEYCQIGTEAVRKDGNTIVELSSGRCSLTCFHGSFSLSSLGVKTVARVVKGTLDNKSIKIASFSCGVAIFDEPVEVAQGSCLCLIFGGVKKTRKYEITKAKIWTRRSLLQWVALVALAYFMHGMMSGNQSNTM